MGEDGIKFLTKDPADPTKFVPTTSMNPGANWFDMDTKMLYITVKGGEPIDIRTTPVIQVNTLG